MLYLTQEERNRIADLLLPEVTMTRDDLEAKFPPRKETMVTRFAPSPTGYLHVGGIYMSMICERLAHAENGVFFLRIEDTDDKREIADGVGTIVRGMKKFDLGVDEGPVGPDFSDVGNYGPYAQSQRVAFYHVFVKELIKKGMAYPCFMTEEELEAVRTEQTSMKLVPGMYGAFAKWRDADASEIEKAIAENRPRVIRFRAPVGLRARRNVFDELRGNMEMDDNYLDIVLLKKNGVPTYHLAHVVDDYLMRTTHVIRAEEWIPSMPLHFQLFEALDLPRPKYVHCAALLKIDGGNKRKLSKRKDPEANVEFFFEQGYLKDSLIDYLANIADSGYEVWKAANPDKEFSDYELKIERFPKAGALFDMGKLDSINKERLSVIGKEEFAKICLEWAKSYDKDLALLMEKHPDLAFRALNIERLSEKDPKRFAKISDIRAQLALFFPETFEELRKNAPAYPENVPADVRAKFLSAYAEAYDPSMDKDSWFAHLKEFGKPFGFAATGEEFKAGGYIGRVGDLAMMLRIALCASKSTPDLYETLLALGVGEVKRRLGA